MEITRIVDANEGHAQLVETITQACNRADGTQYPGGDGSDFRGEGEANLFFAYQGEAAAGYLRIFAPAKSEGEFTVLVRPEHRRSGVFGALMEEGRRELARRGIPSLLLVCDSDSSSGIMAAESYGAEYEFSEYLMQYSGAVPRTGGEVSSRVTIQGAEPEDSDRFSEIMQEAFGDDESEADGRLDGFYTDPRRHVFRILFDERIVGMIGVYDEGDDAYIHGFAVSRDHRGQGIGRQALMALVGRIRREQPERAIILEVQTENEHALELYESAGFFRKAEFRYYRRAI